MARGLIPFVAGTLFTLVVGFAVGDLLFGFAVGVAAAFAFVFLVLLIEGLGEDA
ncbi:MAG: hypothetical protein SVG88_12330 [Halobacteriales archaeon]|nr:hypothetical protein [Halobacteriales archaeon]